MKRPALEHKLEDHCVAYVEARGGQALKLEIKGVRGFPDRTIMMPRRVLWFCEFKREKRGIILPQQIEWRRRLESLGHSVYIIDTFPDFIAAFEKENQ